MEIVLQSYHTPSILIQFLYSKQCWTRSFQNQFYDDEARKTSVSLQTPWLKASILVPRAAILLATATDRGRYVVYGDIYCTEYVSTRIERVALAKRIAALGTRMASQLTN